MPDPMSELTKKIAQLERRMALQERKAKADGWQLNSIFNAHRFGGGMLLWEFDGHSRQVGGSMPSGGTWVQVSHNATAYRATTYGGPNVALDGAADYLRVGDDTALRVGTNKFLVYGWCYPTSVAAVSTIASKWNTNGVDHRSWRLWYQQGVTEFTFSVSATGLAGSALDAASTYGAPVIHTWYFLAGYFEPSTTLNIYVGANTDAELVSDEVVVAVPASVHGNAANLCIGAQANPSVFWPGNMGIVGARLNVPSTYIEEYVNMLFQMSKDRYEE